MNWKEFIETGSYVEDDRKYMCNPPATNEDLVALKEQFGLLHLPDELEELYSQTDGIGDFLYIEKLDELIKTGELIWPIERVIESNNSMRSYTYYTDIHMPSNELFFIADSGLGDMFGYKTVNGKFESPDIYFWDHEENSIKWVAPNLIKFVEGWTNGTISV